MESWYDLEHGLFAVIFAGLYRVRGKSMLGQDRPAQDSLVIVQYSTFTVREVGAGSWL